MSLVIRCPTCDKPRDLVCVGCGERVKAGLVAMVDGEATLLCGPCFRSACEVLTEAMQRVVDAAVKMFKGA